MANDERDKARIARADAIRERTKLQQRLAAVNAVKLYENIMEHVVGQDVLAALIANKVSDALLLEKQNKPRCSVFLSGEAGLGKTYMAEVTARAAYPGVREPSCLIALGDITDNLSLGAKLRGVSTAVAGGGQAGELIPYLKRNQQTGGVVIFDEVDKVIEDYPSQQSIFLQMLDKGSVRSEDDGLVSLHNFILFFTANRADTTFTQRATEVFSEHAVVIDDVRQRPVVTPRNLGISKDFEAILKLDGLFKEPFTRRLDLIAGVQRPRGQQVSVLANTIFKKILGQYADTVEPLTDDSEEVIGDKVLTWLAEKIEDPGIGPSRAEREFLLLFEEQLADILRARITKDLEMRFTPKLVWDEALESPVLLDAEAPYGDATS